MKRGGRRRDLLQANEAGHAPDPRRRDRDDLPGPAHRPEPGAQGRAPDRRDGPHPPDASKKQARDRAIEMLDLVGIPQPERRVDIYPHEFSGGMRQRAMIAMAISCEPDLLIADEPTTALDVTVQAQVLEVLVEIKDRIGSAIMLITHDLGVVAGIADRVMVMYAGRRSSRAASTTSSTTRATRTRSACWRRCRVLDDTGTERLVPISGAPPSLISAARLRVPPALRVRTRCRRAPPRSPSSSGSTTNRATVRRATSPTTSPEWTVDAKCGAAGTVRMTAVVDADEPARQAGPELLRRDRPGQGVPDPRGAPRAGRSPRCTRSPACPCTSPPARRSGWWASRAAASPPPDACCSISSARRRASVVFEGTDIVAPQGARNCAPSASGSRSCSRTRTRRSTRA